MEEETIIAVSVLGAVCLLSLVLVAVLFSQVASLRRRLEDMYHSGRLRVQKLTLENDKNHAFHNPAISPNEELARRGFSMYAGVNEDAESGRLAPTERQTGGQFVEELTRELDQRSQRHSRPPSPPQNQALQNQSARQNQSSLHQNQPEVHQNKSSLHQNQAPPFLLQSIEENKRKSRNLANPVATGGRQSDTNPNFIY